MMRCDQARTQLSEGIDAPDLHDHLRGCEACRTFADALDAVLHAAPAVVPPPPADLRQRVLTAVRDGSADAGAPAAAPVVAAPSLVDRLGRAIRDRRPRWDAGSPLRRGLLTGVAATAALALIALTATVGLRGEPDPRAVLAAAVTEVRDGGTSFAFDLEGRTEVVFPEIGLDADLRLRAELGLVPGDVRLPPPSRPGSPPPPPPLPELPDVVVPDGVEAGAEPTPPAPWPGIDLPDLTLPELGLPEVVLPELAVPSVELPDVLDHTQLDPESYLRMLTELLAVQDPGTPSDGGLAGVHLQLELDRLGISVDQGVALHARFGIPRLLVDYRGSGRSDGAGASAYQVHWGTAAPAEARGELEVVTIGSRTWVRSARTGGWLEVGTLPGFHLGAVTAPHHVQQLLSFLQQDVDVQPLGTRVDGGVTMRGYVVVDGDLRVEAWVDDGERLRQVQWTVELGEPGGIEVTSTTRLELHDLGVAVHIEPPTESTPIEQVPLERYPPFWLEVGVTTTRP